MDMSATAQFIIHSRAPGAVVVQFRRTLSIQIRLTGIHDRPRVLIDVSGQLGPQPLAAEGSERLELAVRRHRGRTVVGAACVDWDEVPLVGLRFIDAPYRRVAEDALWSAYQLFLEISREALERAASRHAAARVWDTQPEPKRALPVLPAWHPSPSA